VGFDRSIAIQLGEIIAGYFHQLRIERGVHLLKSTSASVDDVATPVGYTDGFTRRALLRRPLNVGDRRTS
jgi:transcriptional regulator GlxA family with amidase domain